MPPTTHTSLLLIAIAAVVGLILLVTVFRVQAFLALLLASLFVGLTSGMDLALIGKAIETGVGGVLGSIALVIGLGTVLGRMLAESGGASVAAETLVKTAGVKRLSWALAAVAFLIGLPVFFPVGLMLLVPVVFALAGRHKVPWLLLVLPVVAGLSIAHGLVPPHPGPMAAIGLLKADVGKTIGWSLVLSLPLLMIAGPLFTRFVVPRLPVQTPELPSEKASTRTGPTKQATFGLTLSMILLPVLMMLAGSLAALLSPEGSSQRSLFTLLGHPVFAMLTGVLYSMLVLNRHCGFNRAQLLKFSEECLGPVAGVLLVIGAGGGFSRVLIDSGVGEAVKNLAANWHLPPLLLGWLLAALVRVATGSATVAITAAAGLLAPMVATDPSINRELLVLSLGCGSLILSHVNDGGFWLVKECFQLSVSETLRTWTVLETIIAIVGLGFVLLLNTLI
jgi:gluconate:H+ symporter, GntP family